MGCTIQLFCRFLALFMPEVPGETTQLPQGELIIKLQSLQGDASDAPLKQKGGTHTHTHEGGRRTGARSIIDESPVG